VFDAVAIVDLLLIATSEVMTFPGAGLGFKIYAAAVIALFVVLWLVLRRYEYPIWAVVLLQLVLMGHLAGRFVVVDGTPLYIAEVLGVGGDKIVHTFNSLVAASFVLVFFRLLDLKLRGWEGFVVVMVVAGAGAIIEIIEYVGVVVLPSTHVGSYANNAQDLIANLFGAFVGWGVTRLIIGPAEHPRVELRSADEARRPSPRSEDPTFSS
jgi:putative membrane protein